MKRIYPIPVLFFLLITVSGCAGFLSPSHHCIEDYTPVFAAASGCNLSVVKEAIQKDSTLLKATEWDKTTLLHDAVGHDCGDEAKYLLDEGADMNAVTQDGLTPLHMAAQNGDIPLINLLIERGAKINPVDSKKWTPLDRAEKWEHMDAVDVLKKLGGKNGP